MRAAFVSFCSQGDLQPLIPLAQEWQRRGDDVFIAVNDELIDP